MKNQENLLPFSFSSISKIGYAVLEGFLGTILIVLFLSTLLPLEKAFKIAPWAVGFNSAVTGYSLLYRTRKLFEHKLTASVLAGAVSVVLTFMGLNMLFFYSSGLYIFGVLDLILFLIIGIVFSALGGLLAINYFKLRH